MCETHTGERAAGGNGKCGTFPAALGLAPLSSRSSAPSTFPYLDAT